MRLPLTRGWLCRPSSQTFLFSPAREPALPLHSRLTPARVRLKSRFHTNFAEYRGGRNNIGVLRVCNDDLVQPSRGFGTHGHRDAEIVTYVVSGSLTHADSMGSSETLGRGSVQYMTAGRGVRHSEQNASPSEPLRFVQLWFTPRAYGLDPCYGGLAGDAAARRNQWHHLAGDAARAGGGGAAPAAAAVRINADADVRAAELAPGAALELPLAAGRAAYVLCLEHSVRLEGGGGAGADLAMAQHDAVEATGPAVLRFTAPPGGEGAHLLAIEMAA